jgi:hypothetical protein
MQGPEVGTDAANCTFFATFIAKNIYYQAVDYKLFL